LEKHLHIVCLDVPYPPDYGGVFDLFHKLRYLKELDVKIILHCFEYGRGRQAALDQYCEKVYYYKRKRGISSFSFTIPYIVASRESSELVKNLSADRHPVLLEGIHCTLPLWKNTLRDRKVILRLHNIESDYYRQMAGMTKNLFRKLYYLNESRLLKKYEPAVIEKADHVITVSERDALYIKDLAKHAACLPVFTGWNEVSSQLGTGDYCLYHGNLSVAENETAALWLIRAVFAGLKIPLKIAGKRPSQKLISACAAHPHIEITGNPDQKKMEQMVSNAQINLLPSFSSTGIKLKLLHAVFCGRHCIVNGKMAEGTGLEPACYFAETGKAFQEMINTIYHIPFTQQHIESRNRLLLSHFNNAANAERLKAML
jgi:glycosyltransferase involved in cell wall biosynthesis